MSAVSAEHAAAAARDLEGVRARLAAAPEAERLHPFALNQVVLGEGVLSQTAELVRQLLPGDGEVGLIADRTPMHGPDGEVKATVQRALEHVAEVRLVTLGDPGHQVHAELATLTQALDRARGCAMVVSVGSGTISDIGKYTAAKLGDVPHLVVQTAASVNGFADDQSVLVIDGVKRTTPTRWPNTLLIDTAVLAQAPPRMNQAGLGDMLATYTAPADWLLARLVGQDESFSPAAVALSRDYADAAVDNAAGIAAAAPAALAALAAGLTLSGISMGVAGRTAPGSGMEHTCSHLIEMTEQPGEETLHGAKVGILSAVSAALWQHVREQVAAGALRNLRFPDEQEMETRVTAAFRIADPSGAMGRECWSDYSKKVARWHECRPELERLAERWDAFDAEVGQLLTGPDRLLESLRTAGAPLRLSELGIGEDRGRWAIANCHLMRNRFTIADLAFALGLWDADGVELVLARVAALGGGL